MSSGNHVKLINSKSREVEMAEHKQTPIIGSFWDGREGSQYSRPRPKWYDVKELYDAYAKAGILERIKTAQGGTLYALTPLGESIVHGDVVRVPPVTRADMLS
jgi:hypothetical protein